MTQTASSAKLRIETHDFHKPFMLTQADDFPIHQRPEPVATAGTDRNFYDRYYFQGYSANQRISLGVALGVYPHLDLMDAHFMVQVDGIQHRVFASKHMCSERLDLQVGPIQLQVLKPLQTLQLKIHDSEHGVQAELTFSSLSAPIEEPRFTYRSGPRTIMDLTRMSQSGLWQGEVRINGETHAVHHWRGTRDRSWGVRPIGTRDSQPVPDAGPTQWYWLWAPMHFEEHLMFFHTNDDAHGNGWNRSAVLVSLKDQQQQHLYDLRFEPRYRPGTQQMESLQLFGKLPHGQPIRVQLLCGDIVPKQGEGDNHPSWNHGVHHGALATHFERYDTREWNPNDLTNVHRHAMCSATLFIGDDAPRQGQATLEQMLLGEHAPSGFPRLGH